MKSVAYHPLAAAEFEQSALFYERRRPFLGEAFAAAVAKALSLIQSHPEAGREERFSTRSWRVDRFPFRLVYDMQSERIWIVAVAHLSRKPGYWHDRLPK